MIVAHDPASPTRARPPGLENRRLHAPPREGKQGQMLVKFALLGCVANAIDNGLGRKPPMGWRSWKCVGILVVLALSCAACAFTPPRHAHPTPPQPLRRQREPGPHQRDHEGHDVPPQHGGRQAHFAAGPGLHHGGPGRVRFFPICAEQSAGRGQQLGGFLCQCAPNPRTPWLTPPHPPTHPPTRAAATGSCAASTAPTGTRTTTPRGTPL